VAFQAKNIISISVGYFFPYLICLDFRKIPGIEPKYDSMIFPGIALHLSPMMISRISPLKWQMETKNRK